MASKNIRTRQRKMAQALLPHLAIVRHSDYEGVIILDLRTLTPRQLTPVDADVIIGLEHRWHISTSIFLEVNGQHVTKTLDHAMQEPYKQADLVQYLQDAHIEQLKRERQDQVTGYGWISVTKARDFTPEAIEKIYSASKRYSQN